jgi:hypothetical protein
VTSTDRCFDLRTISKFLRRLGVGAAKPSNLIPANPTLLQINWEGVWSNDLHDAFTIS